MQPDDPNARRNASSLTMLDLASLTVLVGSLSVSNWMALGRIRVSLILSVAAILYFTVLYGRLFLQFFGLHRHMQRSFVTALLAGIAPLGVLTAGLCILTPIGLVTASVLVAALGIAGAFVFRDDLRAWYVGRQTEHFDLLAVTLSSIGGILWVQHYLPPTDIDGASLVFHPIRDFFTHANIANVLKLGAEAGRPGLGGVALPFYHYAGYVYVAIPSAFSGEAVYSLLFGTWTPLALTLVGLATYRLARECFTAVVALWCCALVLVVPDPSYWTFGWTPLGFSFYSFHRLFQMAPSNAFGLAVAGTGLSFAILGWREKSPAAALAAFLITATAIVFKAQIFVIAFPIVTLLCLATVWRGTARRSLPYWIASASLAALILIVALPWIRPYAPELGIEKEPGRPITEFLYPAVHNDPLVEGLAQRAIDSEHAGWRVAFLLAVSFRLLAPLAILALAIRLYRQRTFHLLDAVVLGSVCLYLCYATLIVPHQPGYAWGTAWNLQHIPFLWAYWLLATWTIATLATTFQSLWPIPFHRLTPCLPMLLAFPLVIGQRPLDDDWLRDEHWSDLSQPQGLVECAQFIRDATSASDRTQDSEDDPYLLVEALSERRPYVGWTVVATYSGRDVVHDSFEQRIAEHAKLREMTTTEQIAKWSESTGVRWYLLHPQTRVRWPAQFLTQPVFERDGYRVYDLRRLSG